ncbi:MAG: NADP-dependent phosphogluconate dehydrogenase [Chloroflexota bacterium]
MAEQDIALIGLGVMGQNLALNMDHHGYRVSVYNRTAAVTERYAAERAIGTAIHPCYSLTDLAASLRRPRKILLMVKAGAPVDAVIEETLPLLEPGDIVMDGGNSHFADTARRAERLAASGIHFLGIGISGGEEGALRGPSLMPGGPPQAYAEVEGLLTAIAAKAADGASCVAYLGPHGAGHYVKMVHNGIEYAALQLIAETYDLLRQGLGLPPARLAEVFAEWNRGELASYLVEITADILGRIDPETGQPLLDVVLDQAEQKGTGRWTVQDALELGQPVPTLTAAVEARSLSALKQERRRAAELLAGADPSGRRRHTSVEACRKALFAGLVCAYAEGFALLRAASAAYRFDLDLALVARIWRAGCIVRAALLEDIRAALSEEPEVPNLMQAARLRPLLEQRQNAWREVLGAMVDRGLPAPATSASLAYFDGYRSARLPANLIQAQRDYFGAHTYRRTDRQGTFHTEWGSPESER